MIHIYIYESNVTFKHLFENGMIHSHGSSVHLHDFEQCLTKQKHKFNVAVTLGLTSERNW